MPITADELADQIRGEIRSGDLPAGTRLPSIRQLADQRDASRGIAEQAIRKLRAEGLVESRHGSANTVRPGFSRRAVVRSDYGLSTAEADTDPLWRINVLQIDEVPAPKFVADAFDTPENERVVTRRWLAEYDGVPLRLQQSYFPVEVARGTPLAYHEIGLGGVAAALADLGHPISRFTERVVARASYPDEAQLLTLRPAAIVLNVLRLSTSGERCVEVSDSVLNAEAYEAVYEIER